MKTLRLLLIFIPFLLMGMNTAETPTRNVVICTGEYAKVYHATSGCRGLNNCKGGIKTVTLEDALKIGRRACKVCY